MADVSPSADQARMLVVDDDARNRRLLEGLLRAAGYEVLDSAADGSEGLEAVRRHRPDVVLLDVMMPGMNGHEVCAAIKSDPELRAVQVMLVTALDAETDRVSGLDVGADDYASKPIRREEFLAKVRALVRARRLLAELETARTQLEERNRELDAERTLAACTVHDLKSPLASLLGSLELLGRKTDESSSELVRLCLGASRRMQSMVLDLLDVDRADRGRLVPRRRPLGVVDLLEAAADDAASRAGHAQVRIVVEGEERPEASVDPSLLRRVLDNLLGNAIDHTPRGGEIRLRAAAQGDELCVEVHDDGPGIPVELREKVFEKYSRGALDRGGVSANRGLGLTFCRLAVTAHDGSIEIADGEGSGTLIRARFPEAIVRVASEVP